ncbi:transglycosylase domain-containing protein [Streptomyces jeddahensis]|uniref:Penicillin-binding protein 1A n=1 Tax=Streptomyces jeddahensis TaxID=1716141 RepID=A0A177HMH3_9ACTN|nr:transglycosylase domain-containing protein [Streptomyces jeddahensis]OAH11819.1 penicillin-binding protein 1A [Streptomyces jeddahensis]
MSEHRRKPPQPQGGGRAAARRGLSGSSSGRRAAPRGATGSPSDGYGPGGAGGEERPYGGRAEARRAAQRAGGGGRRRAAPDGAGRGGRGAGGGRRGAPGGPGGPPGRGRRPAPAKKRFIDYPRAGKYGAARWVPSWRQVTGTLVAFFGGLLIAAGIGYAMVGVPSAKNAAATAENNVFYWSDNKTQMAATGDTNRQNVEFKDIPKAMQEAVISAENATFYKDKGVDPMGIARALFNMARGGDTQGGSTITQQFVKNTYLSQDQTLTRKFKELFISIKVNSKLSKDEILAGYLNTAYYGRDSYGIQAAAQAYFGKDSKDLTTEQCVFLAAVLKGPNLYNPDGGVGANATPAANTERAKQRWNWILDREVEVGNMTKAEREAVGSFPKLKKRTSSLSGQTGYLVDIAKEYVAKKLELTPEELDRGGYRIYTTFDKKKVEELEAAVKKTQKSFLKPKERAKDKYVQFGAASVDPENGAIVALYGGEGMDKGHYSNNANTTGVPVGSTWKPIVLASAMEYGTYKTDGEPLSPMSRYNGNDLLVIKDQNGDPIMGSNGKPFRQKNEGTTRWGMVTLRKAMEQSINTPFAQLGVDVGLANTRKTAEAMGILPESFDKGNLRNVSFSLGTSTPSAIRMADAYATFAASGTHYEPFSVTKVEKDGKPVPGFDPPKRKKAMDENVANNVTDVLENVVQNGTGKKIADIGFPVAGKTGTTDKNKSAWFVGYTRELSTAVTLFRTDPDKGKLLSMNGTGGVESIHGGDIPAQVWKDYMAEAMKGVTPKPFPEAEKIGEIIGASPSPTASASPTTDPSASTAPTPSVSAPSPSPSRTNGNGNNCSIWDPTCNDTGGTTDGGTSDGGTTDGSTGGTTPTPSTSSDTGGNGNGNGNGNGGFFGGPAG